MSIPSQIHMRSWNMIISMFKSGNTWNKNSRRNINQMCNFHACKMCHVQCTFVYIYYEVVPHANFATCIALRNFKCQQLLKWITSTTQRLFNKEVRCCVISLMFNFVQYIVLQLTFSTQIQIELRFLHRKWNKLEETFPTCVAVKCPNMTCNGHENINQLEMVWIQLVLDTCLLNWCTQRYHKTLNKSHWWNIYATNWASISWAANDLINVRSYNQS